MTFRSLLESAGTDSLTKMMKNTHYAKNAAVYDGTLYLEYKNVKGALRLYQKHMYAMEQEYDADGKQTLYKTYK